MVRKLSPEEFEESFGDRIRENIKEGDKPIFTVQISKEELKIFQVIGDQLGYYPRLLIGRDVY
jgi:hypothetical protein